MTAAEEHHYALFPRPTAARQRTRIARDGRRENRILRNEANPRGGSPGRQQTRNVKTYGLSEVPTMITCPSWRGNAAAGWDGEPVIAAIGGPEVVIRQVTLPPLPLQSILPALEIEHRELGLLPPGEARRDVRHA